MNPSQSIEPRIEFTKIDFDRYKLRIAPYDKKVDGKALLSDKDIQSLESIKEEIEGKYSVESLSMVRPEGYIEGYIESILGLDELKKRHIEDTKLEVEQKTLRTQLADLRSKGTLNPNLEDRIYTRITKISEKLHPYH